MKYLLLILALCPALLGAVLAGATFLRRRTRSPETSAIHRAIDATCRESGLKAAPARIVMAVVLISTSGLLLYLLAGNVSWAGLGGSWW